MVKYKEFIQIKLAKFNKLPKKWQQVLIFILLIIGIGIYCFVSEDKIQVATSKDIETDNTILKNNVKKQDDQNNNVIYEIDKDVAIIKNPFSFAHEQVDDLTEKNSGSEIQVDKDIEENQFEDTMNINDSQNDKMTENTLNNEKIKQNISTQDNEDKDIYKLKAILNFNHEKVALFSINNKIYRVHQGDVIGNVKIIAIEENNLILQNNLGRKINCPLT